MSQPEMNEAARLTQRSDRADSINSQHDGINAPDKLEPSKINKIIIKLNDNWTSTPIFNNKGLGPRNK